MLNRAVFINGHFFSNRITYIKALECDLISQGCKKKKLRSHWCVQPFEKKKQKSPRLRKSLCCSTTDTLGSYRGLNQSEIVKGGPPSDWPWSRHSCTCVRLKERSTDMGFSIADADV